MDIEAYMREVRDRLGAASGRRDELRSATLGPLGPIQEQIAEATQKLRSVREGVKAEKKQALQQLAAEARRRRADASEQAAKILAEADAKAKELRRNAKELNESERSRVLEQYNGLLRDRAVELENQISSLRETESAALAELGDDLADADNEYRDEYEKVLAERILTRKALETMGFDAPPTKRRQPKSAEAEQKVH
ncbi:hypothetical protein KL864_34470 [Mycolicibacterium goodii]|uniref:hypothetical protein n=1 Tax=Mycolicibacterium goodii TaxID=134601 RepID=UPI001BDC091A|nr:hypothetical protein [Mycolicibacterium goodii]MBU8820967.1 hypothetical protein [Mycolicibacterium goodii]